MRHFSLSVFISLFLLLIGCAPTKGYLGPERPEQEVSIIEQEFDTTYVEGKSAYVDNISFGGSGIAVLPGKHSFSLQVILKEEPRWCRTHAEFNDYGFRECRKNEKKRSSCDCYDYITVTETCIRTMYDAICKGTFDTKAGRKYNLTVSKAGELAQVSALELGSYEPLSISDCEVGPSYEGEVENELGTGRNVAQRYGHAGYCR